MPFAPIRDLNLYFERGGNRDSDRRLLMLSASGSDLRQKPGVFEGPLASDFDILAFDQRGLGQTDKPDMTYTMADYAEDAIALMDHVGWQSCRVFGISFGGMVAQELAVTVPDRIERLVLACTSPGGAGGASYPLDELSDMRPEEAAAVYPRLLDMRGEDAGPMLGFILEALAGGRKIGADEPGHDVGYRRQLEARKGHDTYDRLGQLTMPVLIAAGRYDAIALPSNQRALHGAIPNSRLEWFEGGHVFMYQDPRANEVIRDFLF